MAGARTTLTTVLSMNNTKFKKGLQGSKKQLTGFQKQVQSMKGMIAGAFAVTAITSFARSAGRALDAQVKAEKMVAQAIRTTGAAAGKTAIELNRMAKSLQTVTLFGDEDILRNATAQLLTFTNVANEEFDRTLKVILDVSTVLGQDLKSTAIQVGKALNDPVANLGALGRSGIQFTKVQKDLVKSLFQVGRVAEAQRVILDELEKQYGGQAEAAAEVDVTLTQIKNRFGDFKEAVALAIIPTGNMKDLIHGLKSDKVTLWEKFAAIFNPIKKAEISAMAAAYEEVAAAITNVSDAMPSGGNFMGSGEDFFRRYKQTQTGKEDPVAPKSPLLSVKPYDDSWMPGFIEQLVFMAEAYGKVRDAAKDTAEGVAAAREEMAYFNKIAGETTQIVFSGWVPAINTLLISYEQLLHILREINAEKARIDALNASIEALVEGAITDFSAAIGRAFATGNMENLFSEVLNIFGGFLQQMGAMFIAYGIAFEAFQKIQNPYVLVAAGAALVAIGAAIASSHSSFSSNPSSYSGGGYYGPTRYSAGSYAPSSNDAAYGQNYTFKIEGKDLVAVMDKQNNYNTAVT